MGDRALDRGAQLVYLGANSLIINVFGEEE